MSQAEVVKTPVSMADGTTVEFTARQKCKAEALVEGDKQVGWQFNFRDGNQIKVHKNDVSALVDELFFHGLKQKVSDEFASAKEEGDAFEWASDLVERLKRGDWAAVREPGTGGVAGAGLLVQALQELHGLTREQVKEYLADKTPKDKAILRDHPPIAQKILEIKSRKAKAEDGARVSTLLTALPGGKA